MEEWIDKQVHAVIECDYDEITGSSRPIIAIGDKKLSWEEFGDEVISFEGWSFDFKFSSFFMPPEEKND
ncbi:MAG: hypothetical protein Q7J78_07290 [Clostridiales bacterium]|nr:hypothetical protein [Clostridiales bacterium]